MNAQPILIFGAGLNFPDTSDFINPPRTNRVQGNKYENSIKQEICTVILRPRMKRFNR